MRYGSEYRVPSTEYRVPSTHRSTRGERGAALWLHHARQCVVSTRPVPVSAVALARAHTVARAANSGEPTRAAITCSCERPAGGSPGGSVETFRCWLAEPLVLVPLLIPIVWPLSDAPRIGTATVPVGKVTPGIVISSAPVGSVTPVS